MHTARMMRTAGPSTARKSKKVNPVAEPIMMFGGSPMRVAVPPTFEATISVMKNGTGEISSILHTV